MFPYAETQQGDIHFSLIHHCTVMSEGIDMDIFTRETIVCQLNAI